MSLTLNDFADKVETAHSDHLVQVKAGDHGQLEIVIVATSDQTVEQRNVSWVGLAAADTNNTPFQAHQDVNALTQAKLLQAIAAFYHPNTNVKEEIRQKYQLISDAPPPHSQTSNRPELRSNEAIKPLTCRVVKNILDSAREIVSQSQKRSQLPVELLQAILPHVNHEMLPAMVLTNKTLGALAFSANKIAQASSVHTLPLDKRVACFVELFRFFTGEDLNAPPKGRR